MLAEAWTSWQRVCGRAIQWRRELAWTGKLALAGGMACLTGLLAQARVELPFTPVPLTGQVFAVLLAGVLLGRNFGAASQVIYVALGAAGVPWFSGWSSVALLGVRGGYIIGFIPAAAMIGWLTDRPGRIVGLWRTVPLMLAGVGVIYLFGAVQFAIFMRTGLQATLVMAVLPFIAVDAVKAVLASLTARAILHPRRTSRRD